MDKNNEGLDRLGKVYEELDEEEKLKIVRLAEGLLKSQKNKEKSNSEKQRVRTDMT